MRQSHSELDDEVALTHIQDLYRKFASECPSGKLLESAYMDNVFRSFDANHDNTLDFMEYVAAVHLVLRGKLEDRLRWSFKLYDRDGNGHLEQVIIYPSETENLTPDQITDRIFDLVDKNKDGKISLEEFLDGAQKDQWVLDQLKLDVRPCGWFLEQQRKNVEEELQRKSNK
uniref:EF-hand domain-containing protein n=1 Tax=Hucho hucho TaxID=62062 RepID=A0A4W5R0P9_9TELE